MASLARPKDTRRYFLQQQKGGLRVGEVELPRRRGRRHPLAPDPANFAHFCLDTGSAEILSHSAWCVALREPCLLEGETSTSKTSSILYLASQLGQPVLRLNLCGQTDTGELIGRFAPQGGKDGWCWFEGLAVQALRYGYWLILDEMNLTEPQILERLNPVLERVVSLVLTEYDNSVIGSAENPVHPDFRLFATMNPAEYAGRLSFSPAWRDRWQGYRFVARPQEKDYVQMLEFLVTGSQPPVVMNGLRYRSRKQTPLYPGLSELHRDGKLIAGIARFHCLLESASRGEGGQARLGNGNREKYVFTRRSLLQVIEFIAESVRRGLPLEAALLAALERYYIHKLRPGEDRQTGLQLFQASGLPDCCKPKEGW
jgi:hypothetical protein